ncbi:MAG: hypothetical protein DMG96_17500 [Acidobacteria bacterium]|nr:MAG: hypothetical protein DMG96_17500 [Acidobacteriota bacterium]
MPETLWELPEPATRVQSFPILTQHPPRGCALSFEIERGEEDTLERTTRVFEGVEAFRCTYRSSVTTDMIEAAYGRLVRPGRTPWLAEISRRYMEYVSYTKEKPKELQHLMIYFDDGPCYEVICTGVSLPDSV